MVKQTLVIVGTGWAGFSFLQEASAACGLYDFSLAKEPVRHASRPVTYYKAVVEVVDFDSKTCECRGDLGTFTVNYDFLILAPGCETNTFNTPGVAENPFFVRNVPDAKRVQARIAQLLELPSLPGVSAEAQKALLHIAIIGGGPTGVEVAAELSDLFSDDYTKVYPHLKGKMSVSIFDAAHFILGAFEESLRECALTSFTKRNVQVQTGVKITQVSQNSMTTEPLGEIKCGMVLWTTENKQCPLVERLKVAKTAHLPRILTDTSLWVLSQDKTPIPRVFALGDSADIGGQTLPTTAEVAVQKASHHASAFNNDKFDTAFKYKQKTLVSYIGGHDGVVQGKADWSGSRVWAAWRGKNVFWTRSWREKFMITANWFWDRVDGREIARA